MPAYSNALCAMPNGPFMRDLALAVSNSGDVDSGAAWVLELTARYLESEGLAYGPLLAFDHAVCDIEALDDIWPALQASEAAYRAQGYLADEPSPLPAVARYLAERLPTMWGKEGWVPHTPVTRAVVLADRIDTLVGFFGIGIVPTGSKDPYALRRAALHLLHSVLFPTMRAAA